MIIGFLGAGKMARALATGVVRGGVASADNLLFTTRSEASGEPFRQLFPEGNPRWLADHAQLVRESDLIVLAIKPQGFAEALPALREVSAGKLFLSLAAGVTLAKMEGWLHPTARVIRSMPNTPMQLGVGASVYAGGPAVAAADFALIERILTSAGKAWRVEEGQIDAITALSGSGPAYVFHFIEALTQAGASLGLDTSLARNLAIQTVYGSARLAAESPLPPMELAAQVKSPRGTTLAACAVLEEGDALNHLMAGCLAAAKARAEAMARGEP